MSLPCNVLVCCLGLIQIALDGGPESKWIEYRSKLGGFAVLFPGTPVEEAEQKAGVTMHQVSVTDEESGRVFMAQHVDVSKQIKGPEAERRYMTGQQQGILASAKGQLITDTEWKLGGVLGRELLVARPDGKTVRARHCIANGYGYILLVAGADQNTVRSPDVAKFFNSFQLTRSVPTVHGESDEYSLAYRLGFLLGFILVIGTVIGIIQSLISGVKKGRATRR